MVIKCNKSKWNFWQWSSSQCWVTMAMVLSFYSKDGKGHSFITRWQFDNLAIHSMQSWIQGICGKVGLVGLAMVELWLGGKKLHRFHSRFSQRQFFSTFWRIFVTKKTLIFWLLPYFYWLDSLIVSSELLLVVSLLFTIPVSVLWVGLEKSK